MLEGLAAFHAATGQAPTTSRYWASLVRSLGAAPHQQQRLYPSEYAVLRHFPSFRAAWLAAGIQLDDEHWAPWTADDDRYLVTHLGVQPTAGIAATLRRGEAAVRTRARKLGLCVGLAHGWPLLRVARAAGISEYVLRGYVDRGELPVFKGAKHVYLDPADLPAVKEIDWQQLPAELEAAVLQSLRWRLVQILAGQDWRTMRPHRLHPRENRRTRPHTKPRARVPRSVTNTPEPFDRCVTTRPLHIGLVACSRTKADQPAPARELYVSPLFRAARAYAEGRYGPGQWLILSARYGLVDPDQVLAPYDLSLRQLTAAQREAWGDRIAIELTDRFPAGTVLWFHAGALYRQAIAPVVAHQVRFPLAGLRIGQQLAWYRQHRQSFRGLDASSRGAPTPTCERRALDQPA